MYEKIKRIFEVILSCIGLLVLSPLLLATAVAVKVESEGPVIFKQKRIGKDGKVFEIYKFRSMCVGAERTGSGVYSGKNDARVTKVGRVLRATSIDELPQFFNVLKGDMSLVGPRPEIPHFVEQFKDEVPLYMVKHQVRPGITGWAQVNGLRGDTSIKARIQHDIFYIENWTLLLDVKILLMTLWKGIVNKEKLH